MTVSLWHGTQFGHTVEVETVTKGRDIDTIDSLGSWRGIGIPEETYKGIMASVNAILSEHLVTRYGVNPQCDWSLGEEQAPF